MTYQLTWRDFPRGVTGGQTGHAEGDKQGLIGYCICGWLGPLRTNGGINRIRSQSYKDYLKHSEACEVTHGKKPKPDWGTVVHEATAENEIMHSHRSWRAKCPCGWEGTLHWSPAAAELAAMEASRHNSANES